MAAQADRNLLFGMLAVQLRLISDNQLCAGFAAWVRDKTRAIGDLLLEQNALTESERKLLEQAVAEQLARHSGDTQASLGYFPLSSQLREELALLHDGDILGTLPPDSTLARALGVDTSTPLGTLPHTPQQSSTSPASVNSGGDPGATRYRAVRPHARGGLGELFVATDAELEREVALKEIQERWAGDSDARQRFVLEAKVTGGLEHPGIVPVYGLGLYPDGRPYYAMRFIRGVSFQKSIEQFHEADRAGERSDGERQLALRQLLNRFVAICQAVHYAHSRGVLHRDLKPENVMVGGFGETLVVDWGLAKLVGRREEDKESGEATLHPTSESSSQTQLGRAVGTPRYMSPEQALGWHDTLTPATDVYSLGALLYTLLVGRPAFAAEKVADVLLKVQTGDFPKPTTLNSRVPPALEAIVLKAMSLKAGDRYSHARSLADDIEAWLADEPVSAWEEPWTERARRWIARHQTLVTGIGAALTVAIVALVVGNFLLAAANEQVSRALDETKQARDKAEKEWKRAEAEKTRAEENFRLARSVVDEYLVKVSDDPRLKSKGLEQLRQSLLQTARKFYDKFASDRASDPSVRLGQAQTYMRLASSTGDVASRRQALSDYQSAAKLLAELKDTAPIHLLAQCQAAMGKLHAQLGEPAAADKVLREAQSAKSLPMPSGELQLALARSSYSLGELRFAQGDYAEARRLLEEARTTQQKAVGNRRDDEETWVHLVETHNALGNLDSDTSHFEEAEQQYQAIIEICTKAIESNSDAPDYLHGLANAHHNRALLRQSLGLLQEAEKDLTAALALKKQLAEEHPDVFLYEFQLAQVRLHFADLLIASGRAGEAPPYFDQARDALKALTETQKDLPSLQEELIVSHFRLGEVYARSGDSEKAEKEFLLALEKAKRLVDNYRDVQSQLSLLVDAHALLAGFYASQPGAEARSKSLDAYEEAIDLLNDLKDRNPDWLSYSERALTLLDHLAMEQYRARELKLARTSLEAGQLWLQRLIPKYPTRYSLYRLMTSMQRHLAVIDAAAGQLEQSTREFTSAAQAQLGFANTFKKYPAFAQDLGVTYLDAAQTWFFARRYEDADSAIALAEPIFADLVRREPLGVVYRDHLLATHRLGHDIALARGNQEAALARAEAAIAWLKTRIEGGAKDLPTRTGLAAAHANRARRLLYLARAKDAVAAWNEAAPLLGASPPEWLILERAWAKAKSGEYRAAVQDVREAKIPDEAPWGNWAAALVFGAAADAAKADSTLSKEDLAALSSEYLEAGKACLAHAKQAGYFDTDSGQAALRSQGNDPESLQQELEKLRTETKQQE